MWERMVDLIQADGPMPFEQYMEMCLYDPDEGFFSAGPLRSSKRGDFVTSPEISWTFGYCISEWIDASVGDRSAALVEVGAGSGALLTEIEGLFIDRDQPVYAVERSEAARDRLVEEFPDVSVVSSLDDVPEGLDAVIVANELLDNMPAALAVATADGWMEVAVGVSDDALALVETPARPDVVTWCNDVFGDLPAGTMVSVQLAVDDWIEAVFDRFGSVAMCLIDYGADASELAGREPESVVRTYRQHRSGHDWLKHPGETDLTVDVNVTGVLRAIERCGREARVTSQRTFAREYGLAELILDAKADELMAATGGEIMTQLEIRSERLDMEALIDPDGLGAFRVILVE